MTARRPPMPEPPPRRRRHVKRGRPWRVKGPVGPVTISTLAARASVRGEENGCADMASAGK
jgi:hypothetical protein